MKRVIGICIVIFIMICVIVGAYYFIITISPGKFDYSYDVGNGSYTLHKNSAHNIEVSPKDGYYSETQIIPEKVIEIAWNNQYVIAKQYEMKKKTIDSTYEIPDETVINYWILDTENKKRYGPFSYEEFILKIQEYNIANLELKPVGFYIK